MRKFYSRVKGLALATLLMILATSAFAQIALRGTAITNTSTTNSLTLNKPVGVVAGDVMFVNIVQSDNSALGNPSRSGWTLIDGKSLGSNWWGAVLYRVADGTEGANFTFTLDFDASANIGGIVAFSGVDVSGGFNAAGVANSGPFDVALGSITAGNSQTATATSLTTNSPNAGIVMFGQAGDNIAFSNWQTATSPGLLTTELYDNNLNSTNDEAIGAAWALKPAGGSTGAGSVSLSGGFNIRNGGLLIALKPLAIITGAISPLTYCAGNASVAVSVPFTSTGTFAAGNIYTAQLSSSTGVFPGISIGTLASTANSGTISATIPAGTAAGAGYRIRVISSNPSVTGSNNGANITINNPAAPTGTAAQAFCSSASPTVASLAATGSGIQWYAAATGGTALVSTTALTNATVYYASQTVSGCEGSARFAVTVTLNASPSISLEPSSANPNYCLNASATALSVTAAGSGLNYQWYSNISPLNSGGTAVGTNAASYTPLTTTAGILYYYCVVSGTCTPAVTSNISGAITVNAKPVANAITGSAGICISGTTTLISNATGVATLTYTWASSAPAVASVSATGDVTGLTAGSTNITYTVTDGNGCSSTSAPFAVSVTPTAAAITGAAGTCAGNTVTLTPHATGAGSFTYVWNSSNPAAATVDNSGAVTAVALGSTNISYTVTDGNGCSATSPNYVFSVTQPVANAITAGSTAVCVGSTLSLTSNATGVATLTYSWLSSNPSAATVNASTGVVTGVATGTTDITYTVTDGNGCSVTSPPYTINVNALPSAPTGTGAARCGTGSVAISATPGVGETIDWYAASSGGTVLASGTGTTTYNTPSISSSTTYYAQARNTTTGCISATRTAVIATVNSVPTSTGTNGAICGTGTVNIAATPSAGATIDWYDAATGGTLLQGSSTSFTTPSISATTIYHAEARNTTTGCISVTRTAVTATINAVPAAPAGTDNARCGTGTVALSASLSGAVIDWYANASGGAALASGSNTFTTPSISATTIYYAQSRIAATGCISATRTAVTATVNAVPSAPCWNRCCKMRYG